MRIIVTGSPGTGKTSIAGALGKKLRHKVVNEKQFALERKIGKWDENEEELVIPLDGFGKELGALLEKEKNIILEGHLLCELRLKADIVILLREEPRILEGRLRKRGYSEEKVQDNVFCEAGNYCGKHVCSNYAAEKIIEVQGGKNIKAAMQHIISKFQERGLKLGPGSST